MAQKDIPSIRVDIIRLTALPPPPPTPMTLMMHGEPSPPSGTIIPASKLAGSIKGVLSDDDEVSDEEDCRIWKAWALLRARRTVASLG
mmetsp:Transcript_9694/g.12276  ORF Transcript_9694/g.12276 Transcript_9694/m.12276 type:complete len:88 (+) Transcript_9694:1337-1600(+)